MPADTDRCPLCGQLNQCAQADPASNGDECWCFSTVISPQALARLSEEQIDKRCLCPQCAQRVETQTPST